MTGWSLSVENIAGFKKKKVFSLHPGINLVMGKNAAGKTSVIQSIKLLNNLGDPAYSENPPIHRYLNEKNKQGLVLLENTRQKYCKIVNNSTKTMEDFLGKKQSEKIQMKEQLISNNQDILPFTIVDMENKIIEEIEYHGNLALLKEQILELSQFKYYSLIQKHAKKLNLEYSDKKEENLKQLNNKRKEINLEKEKAKKKLADLEKELNNIEIDESVASKYKNLMEKKKKLTKEHDDKLFSSFNSIKEEIVRTKINLEKYEAELQTYKVKFDELEQFKNLEESLTSKMAKLEDYDKERTILEEEKRQIDHSRTEINIKIKILQETLDSESDDAVCQHCLNNISFKKISKELEDLKNEKSEILNSSNKIGEDIRIITTKRQKLAALIQDQQNIPKKLGEIDKKQNSLKNSIRQNSEKLRKKQEELKIFENELEGIKNQIEIVNKEIIQLSGYDEDLQEKQSRLIHQTTLLKQEIEKYNNEENRLKKRILILPESYNQLISRTEIIINALNQKIERFYFDFIDFVNEQMNNLIEKLDWEFSEILVDDNLDLIIKDKDKIERDFQNLSNFEKKSIGILMILIFKIKYFPEYPIFCIDEHLNAADPKRLIAFLNFIYEMIKDNTEMLIVTSLPFEEMHENFKSWESQKYQELEIFYSN